MINAQEIRMGNYFKDHTGRIGKVKSFFEHKVTLKMEFSTEVISTKPEFRPGLDIDPIPLTPEVIEKCGFKKDTRIIGWYEKEYFTDCEEAAEVMCLSINTDSGRCAVYDIDSEGSPAMTGKIIMYLHQLQNLFWTLTGKELTVNL